VDITRWLDDLIDNWPAVLLGVAAGVGLQVVLAVVLTLIGLPLVTPGTFILAELSMVAAGFVASWLAEGAHLVGSVAVGVFCAFISLIASTFGSVAGVSLFSVLVLLITYSGMAGLGGHAAKWVKARRERREVPRW
jgi:hypothetical protein